MAKVNLEELGEDLQDSVVVLQEILQTQLILVEGQLEKLKDVVEERRFDAVDKALQSQDYVEAYKWVDLAAAQFEGDRQKKSYETRDVIAKQMTPQQLTEAQRLTREWKPKSADELKKPVEAQSP